MSLARDHRVLELSSQAELLERLSLLTSFGSNFVHITGEEGAGKTWIAQRYLETWVQEKNQSLLLCYPNQTDAQRRQTILSQLKSQANFNPDADLVDSFHEVMEGESCNIVIAIDDAQRLSETLLGELWMLVLEAQLQPKWSVSVVLFSLPNVLNKALGRLSYGQEQKPVDLDIELLTEEDADRLFEFSVMRFIDDEMERSVRIAYSKAKRIPGEIMALGDHKMEKRIIIRSIVGSPINIAILIVLLMLAIGGGYWWFLNQPTPPQTSIVDNVQEQTGDSAAPPSQTEMVASSGLPQSDTGSNAASHSLNDDQQTAIPTLGLSSSGDPQESGNGNGSGMSLSSQAQVTNDSGLVGQTSSGNNPSLTTQSSKKIEVVQSSVKPDPNAADDSNALPPSVNSNTENVGVDDAGQRVVISSDVVDALLDNGAAPSQSVDKAAIEAGLLTATSGEVGLSDSSQIVQSNSVITSADATVAQVEQLNQAVSEPDIVSSSTNVPMVQSTATSEDSEESRLLAMPERSYTLQLAAFNSQQEVDEFIEENQLQTQVNTYRTLRQGVTWFIITYDNYATLQLARDAVETLPRPVQALGPWAKSVRQVHREIELGK